MDFFSKNTSFFNKICYTGNRINCFSKEVRCPMDYRCACIDLRVGETSGEKPLMLSEVLFCPVLVWVHQELLRRGIGRFFVVCDEALRHEVAPLFEGEETVSIVNDLSTLPAGEELLTLPNAVVPVETVEGEGPFGWLRIDSRAALLQASALCRNALCRYWSERGVTIIDPSVTYIDPRTELGEGVTLLPGTILRGKCRIGAYCEVGPNAMVRECTVGAHTTVNASQLNESVIGSHTTVGPFAYVRPGCTVGDHCRIGDFVELKNSVLGNGTKVSHLTYVGDSDVGERVNFGCGTVTTNYDGKKKYRCTVGDDVFLGCNTNLIAPVTVGDNAYTAAGSTITEDVPSGDLALARARQVNKSGWVEAFFGKKK